MKKTYKLSDICSIKSGKRIPLGMDFVAEETNHPYIRARDIKGGKIQTDDLIYLTDDVHEKIKRYIINAGDIAITIVGASVGDVSYAQDEVDGYNLTENAVRLTQFKKNVNGQYLYYLLNQRQYHDYMQVVAGGAAQPKLGIYKVERIKVQLPDIDIQNHIVDCLEKYDLAIENNNKRIKILEQMAENLYKEWFVRFRFPGHEDAEFDYQNPRGWIFGDKEQTRKPRTWHFGELRELGEFIRGKNITADKMIEGDIPVISAGLSPSGMHNEANVFGKSLTISASGANAGYLMYHLDSIWAADCSYYQDEKNLWFVYNSLKFLQPVISNMQAGAAQPHVYPKQVNRISIMIPDDKTIDSYCDTVNPIYEQLRVLKIKNENLIKQRDLLLPRLMSGKLEVK